MRYVVYCVIVLVALGIGGLLGSQYEQARQTQAPNSAAMLASSSVEMALAVAEKGDADQATILIRQSIRRAGCDPESFLYIWKGIQEIERRLPSFASSIALRQELLAGLEEAMLDARSADAFERLFKLRSVIRKNTVELEESPLKPSDANDSDTSAAVSAVIQTSFRSVSEDDTPTADPVALMRAGLASLRNGEEDRAEFLLRAALISQSQYVAAVPNLWSEYKAYLDSQTLTPYDRLARLSSYLDSVDTAVLSCRDLTEFEMVWGVRKQVVDARAKSHAELRKETVIQMSELTRKLRATNSDGWRDAFGLLDTQADEWRPRMLIVLGAMSNSGETDDSALNALREMLTVAVGIASSEADVIRKRVEDVAETESNEVRPADGRPAEPAVGECEKIMRDAADLGERLESMDLLSWIQLLSATGEREGTPPLSSEVGHSPPSNATELGKSLSDIFASIEHSQMRTSRLQHLRYNLWALRSIYGAESTVSWDKVLGRIEVGLLHPTVNALYSMTYDVLVRKQTDPHIRTRMVQSILNSEKESLSAF